MARSPDGPSLRDLADAGGFRPERDKKASVEESGTLHKSLEDVAFALGRGQISGVVQHGNQCWILRCDEIHRGTRFAKKFAMRSRTP